MSTTIELVDGNSSVDFAPWLKAFIAHIKKNWIVQDLSLRGCAVISFHVLKDGALKSLVVDNPSETESLTDTSYDAIAKSAPFAPLPSEYKEESAHFRVTFHYNPLGETQPYRPRSQSVPAK